MEATVDGALFSASEVEPPFIAEDPWLFDCALDLLGVVGISFEGLEPCLGISLRSGRSTPPEYVPRSPPQIKLISA
eukprot:CAMPEP_0172647820 /NCGR_PEP_ID=MMETSP1068-20121228/240948_1 /TAXON_ID=35684 /ORGANISM="Pseudopedinella elastica, Strain CCMP716" /LENGTH=75 /DNA_ID=CAMNT_0013462109 /DNA_START=546 /DNA_END=770 /DNA_ORIENTATION=+